MQGWKYVHECEDMDVDLEGNINVREDGCKFCLSIYTFEYT